MASTYAHPLTFSLTTLNAPLIRPLIGLNLWTFFIEGWMYATRVPAVKKYKASTSPQATREEFNSKIPREIQWKADNYNHLMEQPTQFYAVVAALVLLGQGEDNVAAGLAWAYVGLRVVHSLVQVTSNVIMVRFAVFLASSAVLLGLTVRAAGVAF